MNILIRYLFDTWFIDMQRRFKILIFKLICCHLWWLLTAQKIRPKISVRPRFYFSEFAPPSSFLYWFIGPDWLTLCPLITLFPCDLNNSLTIFKTCYCWIERPVLWEWDPVVQEISKEHQSKDIFVIKAQYTFWQ